tara:strand:+ start:554 stop:1348 length:795 start_codon:yes stop_codon:yes gene_type:complete
MSKLEVDKIDPQSGTDLELGTSGDTITIPAGVTFDSSAATNTLPSTVVTTTGTQTLTNKSIATTQLTGTITPSDSTVTLAKLTATGTQDATTFLRGDNTFDAPPLGGITEVDMWRLTADTNTGISGVSAVDVNLERVDTGGFAKIGTGMAQSSGIWTFPSTGVYLISGEGNINVDNGDTNALMLIFTTTDNSNYAQEAVNAVGNGSSSEIRSNLTIKYIFDVTNTSTHKIKFATDSFSTTTTLRGNSGFNETAFTFIRLGDTNG